MSVGSGDGDGPRAPFARVKLGRITVEQATDDAGQPEAPSNARARVLLIESDAEQHRAMRGHLETAGFDVAVVDALDTATAQIERAMPEVVIVGTRLREGTPLATVRGVHACVKSEGVPIVFVLRVRGDDDDAAEAALLFGADELMRAPVPAVDLVARVRTLVRLRRELREMKRDRARLAAEIDELRQQLMHDPLTGLANRRLLDRRLSEEVERAIRYGQPLALALVSVDHFHRVNDAHGRAAGDRALCSLAVVLARCVRQVDLIGRFADATFLAIAPSTPAAGARIVAERLRASIAAAGLKAGPDGAANLTVKLTASLGAVCFDPQLKEPDVNADALLGRMMAALARAKTAGRNRVVFADDP